MDILYTWTVLRDTDPIMSYNGAGEAVVVTDVVTETFKTFNGG